MRTDLFKTLAECMAQRSSSVVVVAEDWEGSLEELARQMMPVTRRPSSQVVPLLGRGPMTIEADLGSEEAERLCARLAALGVPARVVDEGVAVEAAAPRRVDVASGRESSRADVPARRAENDDAQVEAEAPDESQYEAPGWDAILSGVEAPGVSAARETPVNAPKKAPVPDENFGAEPAPGVPPERRDPEPERAVRAERPAKLELGGSFDTFDTARMSEALQGHEDARPPYAPEGFDDRVEHVPAFAALLSFLAPGAGQIYNGQTERVRELCLQVALVRPWWRSVRQAREYAEQIRNYWAPRPEPGALKRALKHVAICWAVGLVGLAFLAWSGTAIYQLAAAPAAPKISRVDTRKAVESARIHAGKARVRGLEEAALRAEKERAKPDERFTMSDEERAERLFLRGYSYCEQEQFLTCASAMKRVSALSPKLRRKAFRLQAWASIRHSGASEEPMPDVGPVESLTNYELESHPPEPQR